MKTIKSGKFGEDYVFSLFLMLIIWIILSP
jgi:hypothetical protein